MSIFEVAGLYLVAMLLVLMEREEVSRVPGQDVRPFDVPGLVWQPRV